MKILVCQHLPQENLGYFEKLFNESGAVYEYQELYRDPEPRDLRKYQALVIMGGSMNVYQERQYPFLKTDYQYIDTAVKLNLPILGFCLGAQLCAKHLGAKVVRNPQPELGWYQLQLVGRENPLFKGFPDRFPVFQWHEDTFAIPNRAKLLASSEQCQNQAFSWNNLVFGLQFHLEVTPAMVRDWLRDEATLAAWGFSTEQILQDTDRHKATTANLARILCHNFLDMLS